MTTSAFNSMPSDDLGKEIDSQIAANNEIIGRRMQEDHPLSDGNCLLAMAALVGIFVLIVQGVL